MLHLIGAMLKRLREGSRALAWALALWVGLVLAPAIYLEPAYGLDRFECWVLIALPPVLALSAVFAASDAAMLLVVPASLMPALVAVPALSGPRIYGPLQRVVALVLVLGYVAAAIGGVARTRSPLRVALADLARPRAGHERAMMLLLPALVAVVVVAPLGPATALSEEEGARLVGVLLAIGAWLVAALPVLRGDQELRAGERRWQALLKESARAASDRPRWVLVRRGVLLGLLLLAYVLQAS